MITLNIATADGSDGPDAALEQRVAALLARMTLAEKIGQMNQVNAGEGVAVEPLREGIRAGRIGAVLNAIDPEAVDEMQRVAVEESRLGIPLLVGRDVIHGYRVVLPIPLGQAATFNPHIVREGARIAALEAAAAGINWTFAPMVDIARDPRWGRIAESLGEDPYLASHLGAAMVEGFQGEDLAAPGAVAACAKHFAGYGAAESGRDYATTNIPENELRNVYLPPFRAAVDAGVATLMTSFSDVNGVPATANAFLLRQVLREEWGFDGFVVSDWSSIQQLAVHGLTAGATDSACEAAIAGVDMDMASGVYAAQLAGLVENGRVAIDVIDAAVASILRIKFRLGLFDQSPRRATRVPAVAIDERLRIAKQAALQSVVLLKNEAGILPLSKTNTQSIAVIGPLADEPYEQLGTWIFDGDPSLSVTGLQGLRDLVGGAVEIRYVRGLETSRSRSTAGFCEALEAARASDAVILFLGEESILSGEAHSRADIGLPGAQARLVRLLRETGTPVIAVIMAGRPLVLTDVVDDLDAILFAWHPGTMGGAAVADLLFGVESPSGRLPATFPRAVGQVPIYYSQKRGGKPPTPDTAILIDDIPVRAPQTSIGNTSYHLDAGYQPLFPFGHGLSYTTFEYSSLRLDRTVLRIGEALTVSVDLTNTGRNAADEVVQLYVRDLVGQVTRPVRELKGVQRVRLAPHETATVTFRLHSDALAFFGRDNTLIVEPGDFHLFVGGSSEAGLQRDFHLVPAGHPS
ncbi:MAG: beta-glucosidase BglX [Steroidobacteraceae bacterium]|nr:beta-glucosidase BglX [Steroidobacteraceae bacterium]